MQTKLDLGKAWDTAVAMLTANKDVVLIVAGVFFFLPNAITGVITPPATELNTLLESGAQPDPQIVIDLASAYFGQVWWIYAIVMVVSGIGTLSLLALLTNSQRPTVGEAIGIGASGFFTYLGVALLSIVAAILAISIPTALGAAINAFLAVLLYFIGLAIAIYLYIKFSLTSPIIAIEGERNPISAMMQSWRLTKGNSFRLFAFYALLVIAIFVLSLLIGLLLGIFTVFGEQVGLFVVSIGSALLGMLTTSIMIAVIAAVHRQLSQARGENVSETFE